MSKHFNMGNVWGRVSKVKEEKADNTGTPYLSIEIECANELYGNVKTYGRLWGRIDNREKLDAFLFHYKNNPGCAYRFKGFFSQYDKDENQRFSNYTFFSWEAIAQHEFKAAFVLVAEVLAIEKEYCYPADKALEKMGINREKGKYEQKISLHLVREGTGNYPDITEDFIIYAFYPQQVDGIEDGDIIEAAGFLRAREPEDDFGRAVGKIMPFAMEIKKRDGAPKDKEAF